MSHPKLGGRRVSRFAVAGALLASVVAQSFSLPAQAQSVPLPPADPYPRASTPVMLQHGGQTIAFRPILTVQTQGKTAVADRVLVRFQPGLTGTDLATIQQKATALGAGAAHPLAQFAPNDWIVDVSGAASLDVAAHALAAADARVVGVGPDLMLGASETPNDPDFSQQSDMSMIGAPTAWNRTHGSPYRRIAILDTGIDEAHPDLNGAVVARQDFTSSPAGADDVMGHGTHVGGIAGAVANNGQGIAGMSFSSNLLNVKVLGDDGQGTISAVVHGIYWAADNGASVINMSFATTDGADCNPSFWENLFETGRASLRDAINYAWAKNVFLVAAAGNTGTSIPLWPATCPHVMSVANLAQDSSINSKSTFGSFVSVAAPGTAVLSTAIPATATLCKSTLVNGFATCSGTSMATPHVAGLAALVQASCNMSNSQAVWDHIANTADPIAGTGSLWQYGRVNAVNAVCFPAPTNLRVGTVTPGSMQLLWNDNTPAEGFVQFQLATRISGTTLWQTPFTTLPANTTSYTQPGLTDGVSYDHELRACDQAGCSDWSNMVTANAGFERLSVSLLGAGKVTSSPPGITCGSGSTACSYLYPPGTVVSLSALGVGNVGKFIVWVFDHWDGACTGFSCTLTMNTAHSTRAVFVRDTP